MNVNMQDLFECVIGVLTLPITLRVTCGGSTGFSAKNMP